MNYKPTIGLEIHVELKTKTKMFCNCLNDPKEKHPNQNVCPVCLGHPGTLPVANEEAIKKVLLVGLALNCKIAEESFFERKNYFYPDLPKGYQISQYKKPLCEGGYLEIFPQSSLSDEKGAKSKKIYLRRIHIEEDTGRLLHSDSAGGGVGKTQTEKYSLVDFNRAGVPLMELVTEPNFESAEEVKCFVEELQLILRYLKVSDADMEKGQLRVEVNISLQSLKSETIKKEGKLGTKVEIKNLNSIKSAVAAINYEIKRQTEILEKKEKIKQETRGWDDASQRTVPQRFKEEAHDYRYFPEPDLLPIFIYQGDLEEELALDESSRNLIYLEKIKLNLPELPEAKRQRFMQEYNLTRKQVELLIKDKALADYFESAVSELKEFAPKGKVELLYNYLTSDLLGIVKESNFSFSDLKVKPEQLAHLISFIGEGRITSRQAKDVLKEMFETGSDPEEIIRTGGFEVISDSSVIEEAIRKVIARNSKAVSDYRKGKMQALQFLLGETMRELRGRGNPAEIRKIIEKELKNFC